MSARLPNSMKGPLALVAAQVVDHSDVAWLENEDETLFNAVRERIPVGGTVEITHAAATASCLILSGTAASKPLPCARWSMV